MKRLSGALSLAMIIALTACSNTSPEASVSLGTHSNTLREPIPTPLSSPTAEVPLTIERVTSFVASHILIPRLSSDPFNVVQQPYEESAYVSLRKNTFTQFQLACRDRNPDGGFNLQDTPNCYGLLADNIVYPGKNLKDIQINDLMYLENSTGQVIEYIVTSIDLYAEDIREDVKEEDRIYSDFFQFNEDGLSNAPISVSEMMDLEYRNPYNLPYVIFQTCDYLGNPKTPSAGRRFIKALPTNINNE